MKNKSNEMSGVIKARGKGKNYKNIDGEAKPPQFVISKSKGGKDILSNL